MILIYDIPLRLSSFSQEWEDLTFDTLFSEVAEKFHEEPWWKILEESELDEMFQVKDFMIMEGFLLAIYLRWKGRHK